MRKFERAPLYPCPATCEICGKPPGKQKLHYDHDHKTGVFRGWLCHNCNVVLGLVNDNAELFQHFVGYLQHHAERMRRLGLCFEKLEPKLAGVTVFGVAFTKEKLDSYWEARGPYVRDGMCHVPSLGDGTCDTTLSG